MSLIPIPPPLFDGVALRSKAQRVSANETAAARGDSNRSSRTLPPISSPTFGTRMSMAATVSSGAPSVPGSFIRM